MPAIPQINAEAIYPVGLEMKVTSSAAFPDMTAINAAHFEVTCPDGSKLEWAATLPMGQTTTTLLTAFYGFQTGDLPNARLGVHKARLFYSDGSGNSGRSLVRTFEVVDKDQPIL